MRASNANLQEQLLAVKNQLSSLVATNTGLIGTVATRDMSLERARETNASLEAAQAEDHAVRGARRGAGGEPWRKEPLRRALGALQAQVRRGGTGAEVGPGVRGRAPDVPRPA